MLATVDTYMQEVWCEPVASSRITRIEYAPLWLQESCHNKCKQQFEVNDLASPFGLLWLVWPRWLRREWTTHYDRQLFQLDSQKCSSIERGASFDLQPRFGEN
jgi:hypothetical protein